MNKVLVTGKNGQLGIEIQRSVKDRGLGNFVFTGRAELDITDSQALRSYINKNNIKTIVNTAAYTDVDQAQINRVECDRVNNFAVATMAKVANDLKILLIHISTDYVFDGENGDYYTETCQTIPKTEYGIAKLKGENAILNESLRRFLIIRTSWLYSFFGDNFIYKILRQRHKSTLSVVDDQIGSPTNARDLAEFICEIYCQITPENSGIYHYSNKGSCSWFGFAKAIFQYLEIEKEIIPIRSNELASSTPRPASTRLSCEKMEKEFMCTAREWRESLCSCLEKIKSDLRDS